MNNATSQHAAVRQVYAPVDVAAGARIKASAGQICILILCVIFVPLFLERTWPLDDLLPGTRESLHYAFVDLSLAIFFSAAICWQSRISCRDFAGMRPPNIGHTMAAALLGLAFFLLTIVAGFALEITRPLIPAAELEKRLPAIYQGWSIALVAAKNGFPGSLLPGQWYSALGTIVLIPIAEELLFRGLLLRRLLATKSARKAIFISSLIFALAHVDSAPVYAFFASCMLGALYVRTGSLWLVTVAHSAANIASFVIRYGLDVYAKPGFSVSAKISAAIVCSILLLTIFCLARWVLRFFSEQASRP